MRNRISFLSLNPIKYGKVHRGRSGRRENFTASVFKKGKNSFCNVLSPGILRRKGEGRKDVKIYFSFIFPHKLLSARNESINKFNTKAILHCYGVKRWIIGE